MPASDSLVGEHLNPSPYKEALAEADDFRRLVALYERVIDTKNQQIAELGRALSLKGADPAQRAKESQLRLDLLAEKTRVREAERSAERLEEDNKMLRRVIEALLIACGKAS